MKSLQAKFNNLRKMKNYKYFSNYILFTEVVKNREFTKETIYKNFPKLLIEWEDYSKEDKLDLLKWICKEFASNRDVKI